MQAAHDPQTTATQLVGDLASEIKGKVVLTTGVSPKGLGAIFVEAIARAQPALLILAARNPAKAKQTAEAVKAVDSSVQTRVLELDVGSLATARSAANEVNSWADVPKIDVLVNNAGIMAVEFKLSPDGYESQLATNHLGPFLFTNLIMGKILASKSPRIVNVSSDGHRLNPIRWDDLNFENGSNYNKWHAYGQSKTANMLFTLSLAEKLGGRGLQAYSLHPGVVGTNLDDNIDWNEDASSLRAVDRAWGNKEGWADFKWKTPDRGAATHVYAAFDPNIKDHNGAYLEDSHVADPLVETVKPWGTSKVEAGRLWKLSEKLVGQQFHY
ncbi:WW domain-containing oxidoreductase [Hypoxylon rubiginosum]|uniref:WW domain-containing oxidoreductase n=1 Tax=Hypoxylon rubiginosum TaxID=110542 RepID=A0ACC0CWM8_9PEZI|nr:WW domain-containing oxidoreductase [Hypoxylon rubiginosum]